MGIGKWITGALGWAIGGPIGGIIGFLIGSVFDSADNKGYYSSSGNFFGNEGEWEKSKRSQYNAGEQRNSFLVSMLVLSAAVMKADGKVMKSELEYVKRFIAQNFGEAAVPQALKILKEVLQKDINLQEVCGQIKVYMNSSQRLQLLHILVGISKADGCVSKSEIDLMRAAGMYLGLSSADINSVLSMYENNLQSAYQVLEIDESATDDEVKRAYKRMAIKHHPDKVEALGADVKRMAEEKFKQIVSAYETIKKERNIN